MNRRLVILLMLCVVVFALSGCGLLKPDTTNDYLDEEVKEQIRKELEEEIRQDIAKEEDAKVESKEEEKEPELVDEGEVIVEEEEIEVQKDIEVSQDVHKFDDVSDFWVTYKGQKYQFPLSPEIFEGWELNIEDEELSPNRYAIGVSYKKDGYISVSVTPYNNTDKPLKISEASLSGLSYFAPLSNNTKVIEIELPNGIVLGSSYEEVISAYGDATIEKVNSSNSDLKTLKYIVDESDVFLELGFSKNIVDSIKIKCFK